MKSEESDMFRQAITAEAVDRRALAHRREFGFSDDQKIDFMTLITKLKSRYSEFDYLRVPDSEWTIDAEAQWDSEKKLIKLPEHVFCKANAGNPRSINTVLHEIGHALLGHKGILNRGPAGNLAEKYSASLRQMEREAKRYAASFLVPATEHNRSLTPAALAQKYGISLQSAEFRSVEIGRLLSRGV